MDPKQVAKSARKIQRAFIKCPTMQDNPTPASLAANSMAYAIAMESAIDRYLAECDALEPTPELTPAIPCTIHRAILRLDPSNPYTWPNDDQHCRYALHDPLLDSNGVPGWMFGEGRWLGLDKVWAGMADDSLVVNALMIRSVYWCPAHAMSESEFQGWMRSIRP